MRTIDFFMIVLLVRLEGEHMLDLLSYVLILCLLLDPLEAKLQFLTEICKAELRQIKF